MSKEKSCLVTQNLISAIDWFLTAPESIIKEEKGGDGKTTWKEQAYHDLYNTVNRVKTPFSEPALRGFEFEKKVYKYANKDEIKGSDNFQKICNEVKGFEFYQKGGVNVDIAGEKCYVYCKYDAIHRGNGIIKDIKTTETYKVNKYLNTFQHKIYCYVSGFDQFEYIIAEWGQYPKIKGVYSEPYTVKDRELLKAEVRTMIEDCFTVLQDLGLWSDYREKYCLY